MIFVTRSLLMNFIASKHKRHRHKAEAIMAVALLSVLVLGLSVLGAVSTGAATGYNSYDYSSSRYSSYGSYYRSIPSAGLVTGQSAAFVAMWLLALAILIPIELSLRKKK